MSESNKPDEGILFSLSEALNIKAHFDSESSDDESGDSSNEVLELKEEIDMNVPPQKENNKRKRFSD